MDSWGVSANATEKDSSHAVTGSLISNMSSSLLNEFRFQWARENRPRPYDGPNITGQGRPIPDTAFDFGSAYRFGMPFFIPVDYFDERIQFNNNLSVIKGRHSMKFGVEYNRVHSNQTFRGFQNGRYIFGSTGGFLRRGNTTLLMGMEESKVDGALDIIRANTKPPEDAGLHRATIFVLNLPRYEQV